MWTSFVEYARMISALMKFILHVTAKDLCSTFILTVFSGG